MDRDDAPGWDAIEAAVIEHLRPDGDPVHWSTDVLPGQGGVYGISAYQIPDTWFFVTFGLTELYEKESDDASRERLAALQQDLADKEEELRGLESRWEREKDQLQGEGELRRALDQLLRTGRVRYAYIGVSTQDVTPGIAKRFSLGADRGALVTQVEEGSPAGVAGIRGGSRTEAYFGKDITLGGDLIVAIGRSKIESADDVSRLVTTTLAPGQTVTFTVVRGGKRVNVDVTLADRPAR